MKSPDPKEGPIAGLDALRFAAAMLVMLGHLRNLFFKDFVELASPGIVVKALYFWTGMGPNAVVIFFVLSGLLVGGKTFELFREGKWSWSRYLLDRVTRLSVVLWPALVLTFAFDSLASHLFGSAFLESQRVLGNTFPRTFAESSTLRIYLANAFFLQGFGFGTPGSNGVLWSLAPEFWYYLAFPLLLVSFAPGTSVRQRAVHVALLFWADSLLTSARFDPGFRMWLAGVATAILGKKRRLSATHSRLLVAFTSLLVVACLGLARVEQVSPFQLAIATALLLYGMLQLSPKKAGALARTAALFSTFSFTLYVTHLPLATFLRAAMGMTTRWNPDSRHLVYGALLAVVAMAWAYGVYSLTERQTPRLRAFLVKRFAPSPGPTQVEEIRRAS